MLLERSESVKAKLYWDSLTTEQELWALTKMGFFEMGRV